MALSRRGVFFAIFSFILFFWFAAKSAWACSGMTSAQTYLLVSEQDFVQITSDEPFDVTKFDYRMSYAADGDSGAGGGPLDQAADVPTRFQTDSADGPAGNNKRVWFSYSPAKTGRYVVKFDRLEKGTGKLLETCSGDARIVYERCCRDGYTYRECLIGGNGCYPTTSSGFSMCLAGLVKEDIACANRVACENEFQDSRIMAICSPAASWLGNGQSCVGGGGVMGIDTAIGCIPTSNLVELLKFALKYALFASGGIIILMIIVTGYTLIVSGGNPEKLQAAKENIVALLSGLVLIAFSLILLQTIGADILKINSFIP